MRYTVTRLCGGKALMVTPREPFVVDIVKAKAKLSKISEIKSSDEMILVIIWKGMEVSIYSNGKIMFHPLEDRSLAVSYANEITAVVNG